MAGNTYRTHETVVIEAELDGVDASISDVDIQIYSSVTGSLAVSGTTMEECGNQKYRYFWDTRLGYAEISGFSGWLSGYSSASGYSGWSGTSGVSSGWSGYSTAVSGLYNCKITARDSNNHWGCEEFKIRIS